MNQTKKGLLEKMSKFDFSSLFLVVCLSSIDLLPFDTFTDVRLKLYHSKRAMMIYKWIWDMHDEYYLSFPSFDEYLEWAPLAQMVLSHGAVKAWIIANFINYII